MTVCRLFCKILTSAYNIVNQSEVEATARRVSDPTADVEELQVRMIDFYHDPAYLLFALSWQKNRMRLVFTDANNPYYAPSPFQEDTILTVRFRTPLSAQLLYYNYYEQSFEGMNTIGEVLRQTSVNGNIGTVINNVAGIVITEPGRLDVFSVLDYDTEPVIWPMHKYAAPVRGSDDTYLFTVIIDSGMFAPGLPARFVDEFDSRLEYVPYSFVVEHGGNRFYPRTAIGEDAILGMDLITVDGDISTMEVDLSALYMRTSPERPFESAPEEWITSTVGLYIIRYEMRIIDPEIDVQTYKNTATIHSTTRN